MLPRIVVLVFMRLIGYLISMDKITPNTPTNTSGYEAINPSKQQGYIVGDGNTDRVLVGFQKDGFGTGKDYGIKVSQDGSDVKTAAGDELVMSSAFNMFKIVSSGTTTLNANATAGVPIVVTVPHGQTFVPIPLAFYDYTAGDYTQLPNSTGLSTSGGQVTLNNWSWVSTDSTNLYIHFYSGSTSNWGIFTYKYYLLQETAA